MAKIWSRVKKNSVHDPAHPIRLLEEADAEKLFRQKSQELLNPFAERGTWPDHATKLPLESARVTYFAQEMLPRVTPDLQVIPR